MGQGFCLCSGCSGTIDQVGLVFRYPTACASQVLGLELRSTTQLYFLLNNQELSIMTLGGNIGWKLSCLQPQCGLVVEYLTCVNEALSSIPAPKLGVLAHAGHLKHLGGSGVLRPVCCTVRLCLGLCKGGVEKENSWKQLCGCV